MQRTMTVPPLELRYLRSDVPVCLLETTLDRLYTGTSHSDGAFTGAPELLLFRCNGVRELRRLVAVRRTHHSSEVIWAAIRGV